MVGAMYDKTNVIGAYSLQNPANNETTVDIKDYRVTTNAEVRVFKSNEKGIVTANLEGFAYILGRLASLGEKDKLFNDFDTYLDPLSASKLHNLDLISGPNYNETSVLSNNHIFDIKVGWAIKKSPVFAGINLGLRTLGFPPRYTNYPTAKPENRYMVTTMNATWKVLYGVNAGVRTTLGKKLAFFLITGVNTGVNSSESTAIQVKYSPFVNPTLFIGKKSGGYLGLYWEQMVAKDKVANGAYSNLNVGAVDIYNGNLVTTKQGESQILIKAGIYIGTKHENK